MLLCPMCLTSVDDRPTDELPAATVARNSTKMVMLVEQIEYSRSTTVEYNFAFSYVYMSWSCLCAESVGKRSRSLMMMAPQAISRPPPRPATAT